MTPNGLAALSEPFSVGSRPPPEAKLLQVAFERPQGMRRVAGAVRFELIAALDAIAASDVLRLVASRQLSLVYNLHGATSGSPVVLAGQVGVEIVNAVALRCRFMLPITAFGDQPLRLMHLGLLYDGLSSFVDWDRPGAWLPVSVGEVDVFKQYFDTFNLDRA